MNRRRLHRWWLLNAAWGCVLLVWESVLLVFGLHGAWLLMPTVPLTVVQFIGWCKTRAGRPRPDYAQIALLEHELLGIEPESLTERYARPDLIQKPRRRKPSRSYPTRGGYMSSDRTIHDLGPFPEAWLQKPKPPSGPGAGSPTIR